MMDGGASAGMASTGRTAAFLDRDGVVNVDAGYVFRASDLRFTPTAIEGIRLLNKTGHAVIVVTNQSGVARGFFEMADVNRFHDHMQAELRRAGAHIDAFYVCPYHPDGSVPEFTGPHTDRKPSPGMILRAMCDMQIARDRSFLVGDKPSDMAAAAAAGVTGILVPKDVCDLAAVVRTRIGLAA